MSKHGNGGVIRGKARRKRTWRDVPDDVLCIGQARLHNGRLEFGPIERPESLCPSQNTVERAVLFDDPRAIAILFAWQFSFPVVMDHLRESERERAAQRVPINVETK
jgi:hypothetical protein